MIKKQTFKLWKRIPVRYVAACLMAGTLVPVQAQNFAPYSNDFSNSNEKLQKVGRGECSITNGVLRTKSAYCTFGDNNWENYSLSFKARAPKGEEQVQIWAGFRASNRFDRYVIGIKEVFRMTYTSCAWVIWEWMS